MAGRRSLYEHQKYGLRWAKQLDAVGLFWQMRLGKCIVATRWAESKNPDRVLIITPLSAVFGWQSELELEGYDPDTIPVIRGAGDRPAKSGFTIATPDGVRRSDHLLHDRDHYDVCILDESEAIKNPKAELTKVLLATRHQFEHRMILSGTPAIEDDLDYVCQLLFLHGNCCGHRNYWNFRAAKCDCVHFQWKLRQSERHELCMQVSRSCYPLTRGEAGIGSKEMRKIITVQMPAKLKRFYLQAESSFELGDVETKHVPVVRTWLARLAGGCHEFFPSDHKLHAVMSLLQKDFRKEPVIIWCSYRTEIAALAGVVKGARVIHGGTSQLQRAAILSECKSGKCTRLIMQNMCMRHGVDLSFFDTQIYYSLPWSGSAYIQGKDRMQHPEKKRPLLTVHVLTDESVDLDVHRALTSKAVCSGNTRRLIAENMKKRLCRGKNKKGVGV